MCFGPSTVGAGAKTRFESSIKKLKPRLICDSFLGLNIKGRFVLVRFSFLFFGWWCNLFGALLNSSFFFFLFFARS